MKGEGLYPLVLSEMNGENHPLWDFYSKEALFKF